MFRGNWTTTRDDEEIKGEEGPREKTRNRGEGKIDYVLREDSRLLDKVFSLIREQDST